MIRADLEVKNSQEADNRESIDQQFNIRSNQLRSELESLLPKDRYNQLKNLVDSLEELNHMQQVQHEKEMADQKAISDSLNCNYLKLEHEFELHKGNLQTLQKKHEELLLYSYNVDRNIFDPPQAIKEYFETVQGSCEFTEKDANQHPFSILPTPFPYRGELLNGVPSGFGVVTYSKIFKYEGGFLNGKKHGPGKLILTDELGDTIQDQQHNHGKRIGPFVGKYILKGNPLYDNDKNPNMIFWDNYEKDSKMQYVSAMRFFETKELTFYQMEDNKIHGFVLTLSTDSLKVKVEKYEEGEKIDIPVPEKPSIQHIETQISTQNNELISPPKNFLSEYLDPVATEIKEPCLDYEDVKKIQELTIKKAERNMNDDVNKETVFDLIKVFWETHIKNNLLKDGLVSEVRRYNPLNTPLLLVVLAPDPRKAIQRWLTRLTNHLEVNLEIKVFITDIDLSLLEQYKKHRNNERAMNNEYAVMEAVQQFFRPFTIFTEYTLKQQPQTIILIVFEEEIKKRAKDFELAKTMIKDLAGVNVEFNLLSV